MLTHVKNFLDSVDWVAFAEQKLALLNYDAYHNDPDNPDPVLEPAFSAFCRFVVGVQYAAANDGYPVIWLRSDDRTGYTDDGWCPNCDGGDVDALHNHLNTSEDTFHG